MQEELSSPPLAVLRFGVPLLREAAWELWPKEKQANLHLECARFLQDWACRCESCSGGDFVPFHRFAIGPVESSFVTSWFCRAQNSSSQLKEGTKLQKPSAQGNHGVTERTHTGNISRTPSGHYICAPLFQKTIIK